jgi:hypothetical protein
MNPLIYKGNYGEIFGTVLVNYEKNLRNPKILVIIILILSFAI